jgi:hypothetical protein
MKDFLDSVTKSNCTSGGSDTDESTEHRKEEKKIIKKIVSKSLRRRADATGEKQFNSDSIAGSTEERSNNISHPTPEMMDIIERLSVQDALVMTASRRKRDDNLDQESSTLSSKDDLGGSFSSISSKSSVSGHSQRIRQDGRKEVNRVPGLEEESSVSSSSSSSGSLQQSSSCLDSQFSENSNSTPRSTPRRPPSTSSGRGSSSSGFQYNKRVSAVALTPQMKGLIERLSVKAALSVISQKECSLIQDAVLDHSLHSGS